MWHSAVFGKGGLVIGFSEVLSLFSYEEMLSGSTKADHTAASTLWQPSFTS